MNSDPARPGDVKGLAHTDQPNELEAFAGAWQLERRIRDHLGGTEMQVSGTAVFTPDALGLAYLESGTLRFADGRQVASTRRYLWRAGKGGRIDVLFEDGRYFHGFAPSGAVSADHWCAPDSYGVRYDFSAWPVWSSRWRVNGPRKDYVSETRFCRP